jgi:hypothetical protein
MGIRATPVDVNVGVIGGVVGISILIIALWCFLKSRIGGGQAYHPEKPSPETFSPVKVCTHSIDSVVG